MPSRQRRIQELGKTAKKCHNILSMFRATASATNTDDESDADDTSRPASPFPDIDSRPCPVSPFLTPEKNTCQSAMTTNLATESVESPARGPTCKRRLDDAPDSTPRKNMHLDTD